MRKLKSYISSIGTKQNWGRGNLTGILTAVKGIGCGLLGVGKKADSGSPGTLE